VRAQGLKDTREAVLDAAERLLAECRLDELTVVDLIQEAGISRASFYVHFECKHAAVAALAQSVMEEIHDLWYPWLAGEEPAESAILEAVWLQSIALWREHRSVLMAAAEAWRGDAAVSDAWGLLMQRYALSVRGYIEGARAAHAAPAEPDADLLAMALVWLNESALYLAFNGAAPEAEDDRRLARTLTAVWLRVIYDSGSEHRLAPTLPGPPRVVDEPPVPLRSGARMRRAANAEVREAILAATEGLLRERRLDELTVVDVIEAAGFSRPTFYTYFESKHAVVAALAEDVMADIYDRLWRPWLEGEESTTEALMIDHYLETIATWREHRAVLVAAAEGWRTDPVVYDLWGARWQGYVATTAAFIERARRLGAAPGQPDAETLASVLVWLNESLFYLAFSRPGAVLGDDRRLASTLSAVWLRAIYGGGARGR
jgi:AcrR family transcriptional regulator